MIGAMVKVRANETQHDRHACDLRHHSAGCNHRYLLGTAPADEPGAVDGGGPGLWLDLRLALMAGEIYTTFAFLGASGWAYSRGGPTLYVIAYIALAYVISFFILPEIWEAGRKFALHTESDFFQQRYGSKHLASLVAIVGVIRSEERRVGQECRSRWS